MAAPTQASVLPSECSMLTIALLIEGDDLVGIFFQARRWVYVNCLWFKAVRIRCGGTSNVEGIVIYFPFNQ